MTLSVSHICLCSEFTIFTVAESSVNVKPADRDLQSAQKERAVTERDERTPGERQTLLKQKEIKKKVCDGKMKKTGEKTSKGKKKRRPSGLFIVSRS